MQGGTSKNTYDSLTDRLCREEHSTFCGHALEQYKLVCGQEGPRFNTISSSRTFNRRKVARVNEHVCVETDNTLAMAFINNGSCKNSITMSWLREIFWLSIRYNFHLRSRHLPGKLNQHANQLSRLQFPDDTD